MKEPQKYYLKRDLLNKKYAVVMLCMLNFHYVLGAIIAAHAHRQFIKANNLPIDLVIMCDDYIFYEYEESLKLYFDRVIKIDLIYYPTRVQKEKESRYSKWIGYSVNKWQCLNLDMYEKVLLIDVDIVPVNKQFYNIFDINTPGFHVHYGVYNRQYTNRNCIEGSLTRDPIKNANSYEQYMQKYSISLDGGCVLLTPDRDKYTEYVNMLNEILKDGMYNSMSGSATDETSLFYFYAGNLPEKKFYNICDEYVIIPWENHLNIINAYSYNFLSEIKPWLKPTFVIWKEERIWRSIYKTMEKNSQIRELFKKVLKKGYRDFIKIEDEKYKRKHYYLKYIDRHPELYNLSTYEELREREDDVYFEKNDYGLLNLKYASVLFS
jgi:hypothetical protein